MPSCRRVRKGAPGPGGGSGVQALQSDRWKMSLWAVEWGRDWRPPGKAVAGLAEEAAGGRAQTVVDRLCLVPSLGEMSSTLHEPQAAGHVLPGPLPQLLPLN